jgi:hypothetical protein
MRALYLAILNMNRADIIDKHVYKQEMKIIVAYMLRLSTCMCVLMKAQDLWRCLRI